MWFSVNRRKVEDLDAVVHVKRKGRMKGRRKRGRKEGVEEYELRKIKQQEKERKPTQQMALHITHGFQSHDD